MINGILNNKEKDYLAKKIIKAMHATYHDGDDTCHVCKTIGHMAIDLLCSLLEKENDIVADKPEAEKVCNKAKELGL